MISGLRRAHAFSLVELTLALGVAAFCLLAVFGLMPIGVQTNRNAAAQNAAADILSSVASDLRAAPAWAASASPLYCIVIPAPYVTATPQVRYFDSQGQCSCDPTGSQRPSPQAGDCSSSWDPPLQTRYQLTVTFYQATLPEQPFTFANLKVIWPATATAANASGSAEMTFSPLNRN